MAFPFPLMPRLFMDVHTEDHLPVVDIMAQTPPIPDHCQWALLLRNRDELTLEMVTYLTIASSPCPNSPQSVARTSTRCLLVRHACSQPEIVSRMTPPSLYNHCRTKRRVCSVVRP